MKHHFELPPPTKVERVKCPDCYGKGYIKDQRCKSYSGTGIKPV